MVNFYVRRIKAGKMTLDEVPAKWREEVAAVLGESLTEENDDL